jgi:hypothetical protein
MTYKSKSGNGGVMKPGLLTNLAAFFYILQSYLHYNTQNFIEFRNTTFKY